MVGWIANVNLVLALNTFKVKPKFMLRESESLVIKELGVAGGARVYGRS